MGSGTWETSSFANALLSAHPASGLNTHRATQEKRSVGSGGQVHELGLNRGSATYMLHDLAKVTSVL